MPAHFLEDIVKKHNSFFSPSGINNNTVIDNSEILAAALVTVGEDWGMSDDSTEHIVP
jgi:hypothetical protein